MQISLVSNSLLKKYFATINTPSILQRLKSYKNSQAQRHMHDYVRDQQQLLKTKKQKIDYEFISKQSAGVMYFREFAFQQKTQQVLVPHLNCYLMPSGSWSFDEVKKELMGITPKQFQPTSKTQDENKQILSEYESDIQKAIAQYYVNIGKKNYKFDLMEEINKINNMTEQQFKSFSNMSKFGYSHKKVQTLDK